MQSLLTLLVILCGLGFAIFVITLPFTLIWRNFTRQKHYDRSILKNIEQSYSVKNDSESADDYDYLFNPNIQDSFDVFHETSPSSSSFDRD